MEDNINQDLLFHSAPAVDGLIPKNNEESCSNIEIKLAPVFPPEISRNSDVEEQSTINTPIEDQEYRIHFGTQPGHYTRKDLTFIESQRNHLQLVELIENFLRHSNAQYRFIRKDAFSNSAWGLEPYTCLILHCSKEISMGIAALIGIALRQDAIGIYSEDYASHPVFTVKPSNGSLIQKQKGLGLMNKIISKHRNLAGQWDENGKHLEFHDFENSCSTTTSDIETTIRRNYGTTESFEVIESVSQSDLLEKKDYENAINRANFNMIYDVIKLTRLHDEFYDKVQLN